MLYRTIYLISFCVGCILVHSAKNDMPIVGIFAQPSTSNEGDCNGSCQYIAASYVKYLESAGSRVVPISYYSSNDELDRLFSSLNGFFFTGGSSSFPKSAQYIFDKVVSANDKGDFTPLWGTCMGFQWLLIAQARDSSILDGVFDSENYSIPLDFKEDALTNSKMFSKAPAAITDILAKQNVTMNNHMYGIYPSHFEKTQSLNSFYKVLSTNADRVGVDFISTIEAYKYPIFGTQWHPEKNPYEFGMTSSGIPKEAINHSFDAISIAQYTANFFVEQTRQNIHSFATPEEEDAALIYNYQSVKTTGSFVESYFFHF
eukprot:gene11606-15544_t